MQTFDIIKQLKMMEAGKVTPFPRDQTIREAREIIERLREAKRMAGLIADERSRENVALRAALKPFADCVYNDNGDVTVTYGTVVPFDYFRAYRVLRNEAHEQKAPDTDQKRFVWPIEKCSACGGDPTHGCVNIGCPYPFDGDEQRGQT